MNFLDLINKYEGASIGVVGSGPSLNEYKNYINSFCDISIACNGALMALDSKNDFIDYFIYGDRKSPNRMWFKESEKFYKNLSEKTTRVLPSFLLPFDDIVLKNKNHRKSLQKELKEFEENLKNKDDYIYFKPKFEVFKIDGIIFEYDELMTSNIINREGPLCRGGTITGVASQLANKMGANKIYLFGCSFNNPKGSHNYAYNNKGEFGETTDKQRKNMDFILEHIKNSGTEIYSFGDTTLDVPKIIK